MELRDEYRIFTDQSIKDLSNLKGKRKEIVDNGWNKKCIKEFSLLLVDNVEERKSFGPCQYQQQIRAMQLQVSRASNVDNDKKKTPNKSNTNPSKNKRKAKSPTKYMGRKKTTPIDQIDPEPAKKPKNVSLFCSFLQIQLLLTQSFHLLSQISTTANSH